MNIRNVKDKANRYCGPAAVSAITGCSTAVAAHLMRAFSGARYIKSSSTREVRAALDGLGYSMCEAPIGTRGATLAQWLRETSQARGSKVYLIHIGSHWAVVQGRRYVCSLQREVCSAKDAPMRRARFHRAHEITKTHGQRPGVTSVKQRYGDVRLVTRAPKPEPTAGDVRLAKLRAIEARLKRWETKAKRAKTAIAKLHRSKRGLERALAAPAG